jgi:glycosyltransferase involved in cell wall biosynthesis
MTEQPHLRPDVALRAQRRYRFGFILNTSIGNMTRYVNFRKYAERDTSVELLWAPVSHYLPPNSRGLVRYLPSGVRLRAFVLAQTSVVLSRLGELDGVMVHLFEADVVLLLRRSINRRPLLFSSTDEAPMVDRDRYPLYPNDLKKSVWRQKLRLAIDMWRVRHTDYFVPFSRWAADILINSCGAPTERVYPIHVGLDLELWPAISRQCNSADGRKVRLLFVGGDFARKGGDLLLEVYLRRFVDMAELHLVSAQAPQELPDGVHVYRDFTPNDPRLRELYAACDALVVPTTADTGPLWVFMEAMASGMPVVGTDTGANRELVRDGDTGFVVPIGDADALGDAVERLLRDPAKRLQMGGNGRALIEAHYSAEANVPRILQVMKDAVDEHRTP